MDINKTDICTIEKLQQLRKYGVNSAQGVFGENLLMEDFFFITSLDKTIRTIDGYIEMHKTRNLFCMGSLLRIQLDNCMRVFAAYIAVDKDNFMNEFIKGEKKISEFEDINGEKMKDWYLRKKIAKLDPVFSDVYEQCSGYIHLSHKSFSMITRTGDSYDISMNIGGELDEKCNEYIDECTDAFIYFLEFYYEKLLKPVVISKKEFDDKMKNLDGGVGNNVSEKSED